MKKIIFVVFALGLQGCGEKINDVDFYIQNPTEIDNVLKNCDLDKADKNCENAYQASRMLFFKSHSTLKDKEVK